MARLDIFFGCSELTGITQHKIVLRTITKWQLNFPPSSATHPSDTFFRQISRSALLQLLASDLPDFTYAAIILATWGMALWRRSSNFDWAQRRLKNYKIDQEAWDIENKRGALCQVEDNRIEANIWSLAWFGSNSYLENFPNSTRENGWGRIWRYMGISLGQDNYGEVAERRVLAGKDVIQSRAKDFDDEKNKEKFMRTPFQQINVEALPNTEKPSRQDARLRVRELVVETVFQRARFQTS